MLGHRTNQALLLAALAASCGGGGGDGGGTPNVAVSAGEDTSSLARARVILEATAPEGEGVGAFQWEQVSGPAVVLEAVPGGEAGTIGFRLLIVPAAALLWPWLLVRWARRPSPKPEATNR